MISYININIIVVLLSPGCPQLPEIQIIITFVPSKGAFVILARARGWATTRTHDNPIKNAVMFLHGGLDPPTLALHRRVNLPTAIFRKYKRIFDI